MSFARATLAAAAFAACACAPALAESVQVDLPVSGGSCKDYVAIAEVEAMGEIAGRHFPTFASNVSRVPAEKVIRGVRPAGSRPNSGKCSYQIDVNTSALEVVVSEFPPGLGGLPVAALFRYVRDGRPVPGDTPDAVKATQIFLDQIHSNSGQPIELVGLSDSFRKLAFFNVAKCAALVDSSDRFSDPECQAVLDYDQAVEKIVYSAREIAEAEVSTDEGFGNPQIAPLATCNGIVLVGQVTATPSTTARNQLDVAVQASAYRYDDARVVTIHPQSVTYSFARSAGSRESVEAMAINEVLQRTVSDFAQKVADSGQRSRCSS